MLALSSDATCEQSVFMSKSPAEKGADEPNLNTVFGSVQGARVPFTRICSILSLVDFLDVIGAPTERLLQRSGIPIDSLEQPESLLPLHLAYAFTENIARSEGIEDLGFVVAQQVSAFELGVFGCQLREALTVYDYLRVVMQHIDSLTSGQQYWLTSEGSQVRVHQHLPGNTERGFRHADRYSLAISLNMLSRLSGNQWQPEEIVLHPASKMGAKDSYSAQDICVIEGQTHSSFTIPKALLSRAIPRSARGLQTLEKQRIGNRPGMPDDLLEGIREIIALLLPEGYPNIQLAAEAAGMSTRTLQRRLGMNDTSYSQLVTQIRMQIAADKLADNTLPVYEIAQSLGYRDPANFSRAFRQKTGVSPQDYRAQIQE